MLKLQCKVDQTLDDADATDKEYSQSLIELHAVVVDEWDDV